MISVADPGCLLSKLSKFIKNAHTILRKIYQIEDFIPIHWFHIQLGNTFACLDMKIVQSLVASCVRKQAHHSKIFQPAVILPPNRAFNFLGSLKENVSSEKLRAYRISVADTDQVNTDRRFRSSKSI